MFKPGWQTTEFWAALAAALGTVAASAKGWLQPEYSAIAVAIEAGAYALARALTKAGGA